MSNSPPQSRPSKAMSSRLMTMKFMQRAAASAPPSTPQLRPLYQELPPSKRQKPSNAVSTATPPSELQMIQSGLDEQEQKRRNALEKLAEEAGETKWVLSTMNNVAEVATVGLRVAKVGYSDIDQDAWKPASVGRRSFGKFNKELKARQGGTAGNSSTYSDEEPDASKGEEDSNDDSDDPAGTRGLIRAAKEVAAKYVKVESSGRKRQRTTEEAELARLAEKRRRKEVQLNNLSSISGARRVSQPKGNGECFACGKEGHMKAECPQRGHHSLANGRGRDSMKSRSSLDH
ncbi:hypothetical protein N7G274_006738 [Stereocaulon virgatum]|uniref:CCHC-type domain-containing protein n=1 Tax=Stereocaulon virgatum TaxID=373712 RepID=A0ABR4A7N9_9LECA